MTEGAPDDPPLTCYKCEKRMAGGMWCLTRSMQRVHFTPPLPEVEVDDAECLSYYCSHAYMKVHVPAVAYSGQRDRRFRSIVTAVTA